MRQWNRGQRSWRAGVITLFLMSLGLSAISLSHAEPSRPLRIGALISSWGPTPNTVGFRDGIVELGYRENEDFFLGVRFTQGDITALPAAARQLVGYGVDLILTDTNVASKAAKTATTQIPIVFTAVEAPVESGLVQSFAQPGGNITGVTNLDIELGPKRLQVFQEIVPELHRVLFVYAATETQSKAVATVYRDAARRLGLVLIEQAVRTQEEIQIALSQARQNKVDGILSPRCCALNIPGLVLEAGTQQKLPTMFPSAEFWIERGALATYGPNFYESGRQAARLADKIFKGADPGKLPVEVNSNIEFTINLKTAKALGITITPDVLFQADRLIR